MRSVKVKKLDLVRTITVNREAHKAIFQEAVEGYRDQAIKLLEEHIERIRHGSLVHVQVSLPQPVNHLKDYDRILCMLDMEVAEEVEIDESSFAAYVMDDWHWKQQFLASNAMYSQTAQRHTETNQ